MQEKYQLLLTTSGVTENVASRFRVNTDEIKDSQDSQDSQENSVLKDPLIVYESPNSFKELDSSKQFQVEESQDVKEFQDLDLNTSIRVESTPSSSQQSPVLIPNPIPIYNLNESPLDLQQLSVVKDVEQVQDDILTLNAFENENTKDDENIKKDPISKSNLEKICFHCQYYQEQKI